MNDKDNQKYSSNEIETAKRDTYITHQSYDLLKIIYVKKF